ncbi:MAG: DUF4190 domain-containing protein [Lentisphaeria bacterium]|nr:DUF4190 domain-containing protein [Lentisphaeria bacterium]
MNCPNCNNPIPANANNCPGCGAPIAQQQATQVPADDTKAKSCWMAITSMVLGITSLLVFWGEEELEEDVAAGGCLFAILALVFGIISLCQKQDGKGMAIAGIATAACALLI